MVKLIAKRPMKYGKRGLAVGDVFEARDKDARILSVLGRVDVYVEPVKPKRRKAEEAAPVESVEPGEYLRRDMRAED